MGVLAAALGLGIAEMVAGTSRRLASPVVSIGDRVIDRVPAGIKQLAIDWFGTNDKTALVVGILVVLAILAAPVGIATVRGRRDIAIGAAVVLGVVGVLASSTGRNTRVIGAIPSIVAAVVAGAVLLLAHRIARPETRRPIDPAAGTADGAGPRRAMGPDRRTLLLTGTGVAAGAVITGSLGRFMHRRLSNAAERASVALPAADTVLPDPPADPALDVPGLSPLFTPNTNFYRIDTALVVPSVTLGSWRLRVTGMVERELELTFDDLLALPQVESDITISCVSNEVGGDLVGNARWQGVRLDDLLAQAGISPEADQIVGRSVDGFTAGFPTATLDGRNALVALAMNGEPLPTRHGFPARLVVPGLYGYVSATKWLSAIELTRFDQFEGYWVPRGWSALAPIKTQSRIDRPGRKIDPGRTAIAGVAWAPTRGIASVEVRIDEEPWRDATLGPSVGDDSWRQWWIDWDATPGRHVLTCRAADGTGEVQTEERSRPDPNGATGWHTMTVTVSG
ncbi:MAG: molybdopterin-dependent oxidoreductase [Acidimicrobiia bacterium]